MRERERDYDEEDGIGGFGPDGGIDGVFDFAREHVIVQVLLDRHFASFFGFRFSVAGELNPSFDRRVREVRCLSEGWNILL